MVGFAICLLDTEYFSALKAQDKVLAAPVKDGAGKLCSSV